jgi:hypothetical protein
MINIVKTYMYHAIMLCGATARLMYLEDADCVLNSNQGSSIKYYLTFK